MRLLLDGHPVVDAEVVELSGDVAQLTVDHGGYRFAKHIDRVKCRVKCIKKHPDTKAALRTKKPAFRECRT